MKIRNIIGGIILVACIGLLIYFEGGIGIYGIEGNSDIGRWACIIIAIADLRYIMDLSTLLNYENRWKE